MSPDDFGHAVAQFAAYNALPLADADAIVRSVMPALDDEED